LAPENYRIVGLPDGEEIVTLVFVVLTQYRTDRRTDTLRFTRASTVSRG